MPVLRSCSCLKWTTANFWIKFRLPCSEVLTIFRQPSNETKRIFWTDWSYNNLPITCMYKSCLVLLRTCPSSYRTLCCGNKSVLVLYPGWLFVFICFVAVVWVLGCGYHGRKKGRIMGRHRARSRVANCRVATTGTLITITCVTPCFTLYHRWAGVWPFFALMLLFFLNCRNLT